MHEQWNTYKTELCAAGIESRKSKLVAIVIARRVFSTAMRAFRRELTRARVRRGQSALDRVSCRTVNGPRRPRRITCG